MEYVNVSLREEIEQLEQEVVRELESMERVLAKNTFGESALSWFKNQVQSLKLDTENKMKDIDNNITLLKEELTAINDENRHLHEMVVFLGNQLNARMSTKSERSIEDSSLFLDDIVNNSQAKNGTNEDPQKLQRVFYLEGFEKYIKTIEVYKKCKGLHSRINTP